MNYTLNPLSLWDNFCLYWRKNNLLPKLVTLNLFSFVVFAAVENTLFRYVADMTFHESMKARGIATIFNTLVGIAWPQIELFFESKFAKHPIKFLRDKWEEFSLLCVKVAVNICTYALSGHYAFNLKLGIKVGVIVFISFYCADFLKYKLTPFVDTQISKVVLVLTKKKTDPLQHNQEPTFSDIVLVEENQEEDLILEESV